VTDEDPKAPKEEPVRSKFRIAAAAAEEPVKVKLHFRVPPRMPTVYAHHMLIQGSENEVLVSFFEVIPPPLLGSAETQRQALEDSGITAECVARVTISRQRFPEFAKAFRDFIEEVPEHIAQAKPD